MASPTGSAKLKAASHGAIDLSNVPLTSLLHALCCGRRIRITAFSFLLLLALLFAATTAFWGTINFDDFDIGKARIAHQEAVFSQYRFTVLQTRSNASSTVRISEIEFRDVSGVFNISKAYATSDQLYHPAGGDPTNAIDGNTSTSWQNIRNAALIVYMDKPIAFTSFRFFTADVPGEDPIQWKLEGSNGGKWIVLHLIIDDYTPPTERGAPTEWFEWFDFDARAVAKVPPAQTIDGSASATSGGAVSPQGFAEYCFTVKKLRTSYASEQVQISEIEFRNGDRLVDFRGSTAKALGEAPIGQGPERATDGDTVTKWFSFHLEPLCITWTEKQIITSFRFFTADDFSRRDPVQWVLEGRSDQGTAILHSQTIDYRTPTLRFAPTEWFDLNLSAPVVPISQDYSGGSTFVDAGDYCFVPTKLRHDSSSIIQISEIQFRCSQYEYNETSQESVQVFKNCSVNVSNNDTAQPGGILRPYEGPEMAVDGKTSTKWVGDRLDHLCVHVSKDGCESALSYRLFTANDLIGSDPVQWYIRAGIYESNRSDRGVVLHNQSTSYNITMQRGQPTAWFELQDDFYQPERFGDDI